MADQPLTAPTDADAAVRKAGFVALLERAEPVEQRALAEATGRAPREVAAAVERLRAAGQIELDQAGRVGGAGGLSLLPTVHRLTLRGRAYYTWCAEDAVGIPAALGEAAEVESECAHCRAPVRLTIRDGTPAVGTAIIGFGALERCESVRDELCPTINFFCHRDHFAAWRSTGNENARDIDLTQAAALGKVWWEWAVAKE